MRISIHVTTRDRHTELALLIQSLRTQTYKKWDLVILDECTTPVENNYFLMAIINRVKLENHNINIIKNNLLLGVCHARNKLLDEDKFNNPLVARVDDDVILDQYYLEKLVNVIDSGYDIASGVTPNIAAPQTRRKVCYVKPIINQKIFDKEGNIVKYGDDCGMLYNEEVVLLTHEFRSCAVMKKEVTDKIKYKDNLSQVGFREEAFFSFASIWAGYRIAVNTQAIAWHFQCPTGGCRWPDYQGKVQSDNNYFMKWAKEQYLKNGELYEEPKATYGGIYNA